MHIIFFVLSFISISVFCQKATCTVLVIDENRNALAGSVVSINNVHQLTDSSGKAYFSLEFGNVKVSVQMIGYFSQEKKISLNKTNHQLEFQLEPMENLADEVVVTDNLLESYRSNSVTSVEVYGAKFFQKSVSPNLFQSMQMINGVQPQLLCNVCNTGDIHINGLEGPYTLVLIDGMPIVSSLSTVYGLMGISQHMIDRIEIVKGPASTIYGSDAVGGIVNIITKNPEKSNKLSVDFHTTTWAEHNLDASFSGSKNRHSFLIGSNYHNFTRKKDNNNDGFTDATLQHRASFFAKYKLKRKNDRMFNIASRLFYEDRWGGQVDWERKWRGTDSIYGESIYTKRLELVSSYQLPIKQTVFWNNSYNYHDQNSVYGTTFYLATQHTGFSQMVWQKKIGARHHITSGATFRIISLKDNTPVSWVGGDSSKLAYTHQALPGLFAQNETALTEKVRLLVGARYDYHNIHGSIVAPRAGVKVNWGKNHIVRLNAGNGFRVVNLFTEDHAALSGAREVVVKSELRPEKSWNANLTYTGTFHHRKGFSVIESQGFYTYFTNRIQPNYDEDPTKIIYDNLNGFSVSSGVSLSAETNFENGFKLKIGNTWMDVFTVAYDSLNQKQKTRQVHAPRYQGNFLLSYTFKPIRLTLDYSGVVYGPMRLPIVPDDFRPEYSPWFSLQNIQLTFQAKSNLQLYFGAKNLLNFIPENPILRPNDPFDKRTNDPIDNPKGYFFDPTYNYAPLQGIRLFLGIRYWI